MPVVPDEKPRSGDRERPDLAELIERRALTRDEARDGSRRVDAATPAARTARENIADLVDPGSLVEYGRFAIAAQRGRREVGELIAHTPADGLVAGTAASTASSSASAAPAPCSPTTTPCSPAPRAPLATARRTASSS